MRRQNVNERKSRPEPTARAGSRCRRSLRRYWPMIVVGLLATVAVSMLLAANPETADAKGGWIDGFPDPGDAFDAATGAVKDTAVGAFGAILGALFGGIQAKVTQALLTWLIAVPNFTGGNVAELSKTLTGISFGLVAVVMTFAVIRFWLSGLSSSGAGGAEAVDGFTRTIGAALFILAWPFLARQGIAITNTASSAILHSPSVSDDLTRLIRAALVGNFALGPVAWIISVITALAGAILLLGLVLLKIVLSSGTAILFVGMPVAVILWPITELSWVARFAMRSFFLCLLIPLVWVIVFGTFAAIGVDAVSFEGGGGILDRAIIKPLTGCALLYVAVSCPKWLMRAAMMGARPPGGGFMGRTASYMAARRADMALAQHLPASIGGSKVTSPSHGPAPVSPPSAHAGSAQTARTAGDRGGGPADLALGFASAARSANDAASSHAQQNAGSEQPTTTAEAIAAAAGAADGHEAAAALLDATAENGAPGPGQARRPFNQAAHDAEVDAALAKRATAPPTRQDVAHAVQQLTATQQPQAQAVSQDLGRGEKPLAKFAEMAAHEPATPAQRQAFRTLAAAENNVRAAGIADGLSSLPMTDSSSLSDVGAATSGLRAATSAPENNQEAEQPPIAAPHDSSGSAFAATSSKPPETPHQPASTADPAIDSPATPPRAPRGSDSPIAKG
jgi:hypothetical protein